MLVGRRNKETTDTIRITVDFTRWLDPYEQLTAFTAPAITALPATTGALTYPSNLIADTTPLVCTSSSLTASNTRVVMFLTYGTPGFTYDVAMTVTGGSGRRQTVHCLVAIKVVQ